MKKGHLGIYYKIDVNEYEDYLKSFINEEDIYDNDSNDFGLAENPHITVLFGFNEEVKIDQIKPDMYDKVISIEDIELKGISIFESSKYDVLKIDIESNKLNNYNEFFKSNFPYESDFDEYHPHLTISYIKKGMGKYYTSGHTGKDLIEGIKSKLKGSKLFYKFSDSNKKESTFSIICGD